VLTDIGDKCGATFIDRSFKEWVKGKIGEEMFQVIFKSTEEAAIGSHTTVQPETGAFMTTFETTKRKFDGNPTDEYLLLPREFAEMDDDPKRGIFHGDLRITE